MIFCFVVGTAFSSVFEVDGQIKMTTAELKDMIYEKTKNYFENKKIDARDLNLWLVDIPYNTENVQLRTLQNRSRDMIEENIIQELGGKKLSPVNDIGDIFTYDSKNIRIIIQPPVTTDQGHTDVSRVIANLGYLPRQGGLGGTMLPSDPKIRSTNEGVNINDPDISLRFDIISSLVKDLMDKKVILVRAPPFSGKTSLAQILEYNLVHAPEFLNHRIVRVSMIWGQSVGLENCYDSFGELWKRIIGIDWFDWLEQCRYIETILIIDEAQLIYGREKKGDERNRKSADQFWMIVKGLLQEVTRINIIMFAPYGYRSSNTTGLTTPVTLPESNCKSLIDINFTCDELEKYIGKFCGKYFRNLDSSGISSLYKYIQVVTEGHAGLVRHILMSTEDAMKKRIDINRLTWEEIFKYLNSREFDSSIYTNCRAVPKVSALFDRQKKICEDVCLNEKILYIDDDKDAEYLVRSGILIIVDTYITFAAPLLKRLFFQQNYGVHNSAETTPTDLHHFIVKIFAAMCNELSGKILRDTLGFESDGRILEQTWQKEFYRIGTQVLGRNHFLSFEVGSVFGCEGKIVFYVDKLDWAIEFLRDGEDMAKHKRKFEPGGEYREIVKYAKSIAIIDICSKGRVDTCNEAKKVQEMKADFIYVSCSKDFDAFKIECLGKETVIIKV